MKRYFNITGACDSKQHYMIDLQNRLKAIRKMIERGQYFVINQGRQYGKTTILKALFEYLKNDYFIFSLDFQLLSHKDFESEVSFVKAFARILLKIVSKDKEAEDLLGKKLEKLYIADIEDVNVSLNFLFDCLNQFCEKSKKPVVLMIDEIDSASNYQIFLDFLAQLRGFYLNRDRQITFQSVIFAGVYDIKNIKQKIRPESEHRKNSPWNIAVPFKIDMSFQSCEIASMLKDYEKDYATDMNIEKMAQLLYDYTSGYPFLVSKLCQLMDEEVFVDQKDYDIKMAWTKEGFLEAVKLLLFEKNTLFESLINKLYDYPKLKNILYSLLFYGKKISYSPYVEAVDIASMFGFIKNENGFIKISNRIFETRLYNMFLTSDEMQDTEIYNRALDDKNQFIVSGHFNMEYVLEKFVSHFYELYGNCTDTFIEEDGRRYFLLYLRPIINGVGNYYIEAQTRDRKRTDVIVDYKGEQFVIELKIWHGNAYHERGEEQLIEYLDYYHLKKGYMLSFNFNKKKEIGVKNVMIGDRILIEAVV